MIKTISADDLARLTSQAQQSERQRAHLNVHDSLDAPVQRLFIAMEPGTYIPPHRHPQANKWEFLAHIAGTLDLLVFDDDGKVLQRKELSSARARTIELPPGTLHSYVSRATGTVVLEIKEGPYIPASPEDLAPWAPAEQDPATAECLDWLRQARVGDRFPS